MLIVEQNAEERRLLMGSLQIH